MPSEFIKRQKSDFFRDFSALGSLWLYLLAVLIFFMFRNYMLLNKLAIGLVLMQSAVIIIRTFYFKERPNKYPYKSYIERIDASSFPSLHSARITFLAIAFMNYYNEMIFSILLAALAVIVMYSRIYLKKHDLKDVLAGAILGAIVYFAVVWVL